MTSYYQQHAPYGAAPSFGYAYQPVYPNYNSGYDLNNYGGFNSMMYNNGINQIMTPIESTLNDDEAAIIGESAKNDVMSLKIDKKEACNGLCNHHGYMPADEHGNRRPIRVLPLNDGSGEVYCEFCGARWNPELKYEEVFDAVKTVDGAINNIKYVNPMPKPLARQYYSIVPILRITPDIYKYVMNRWNNNFNQPFLIGDNDRQAMSDLMAVMPSEMVGMYDAYNNPYAVQYQQPVVYGNQIGGMQMPQQQIMAPQQGVVANPAVNPMQATYGINQMAPNQQFVQQAQMMMPGGVQYQQPSTYQPVYQNLLGGYGLNPQQQQQPTNPYMAQQAQPADGGQQVVNNGDGTESSSSNVITL